MRNAAIGIITSSDRRLEAYSFAVCTDRQRD